VTGAAGTGESSSFSGTILATGAITLGAGSTLAGRALSRGLVTLTNNTISPQGSSE
jgi:Ice-binding-like